MPSYRIPMGSRGTWLTVGSDHEPGDLPPGGYTDWHEWAEVQHRAGLHQVRCSRCGLFRFPQELARTEQRTVTYYRTKRDAALEQNEHTCIEDVPTCLQCAAKEEPNGPE
jgi:hypothetical protein